MGKNPFGLERPRSLVAGFRKVCLTFTINLAEPEKAVRDMRTCDRTVPCNFIGRSPTSR
jgi:hypothetical protein